MISEQKQKQGRQQKMPNYETFDLNKENVEKSIQEWIKGKDKGSSVLHSNISVV